MALAVLAFLVSSALLAEAAVRLGRRFWFSALLEDPVARHNVVLGWDARPGARAEVDGAEVEINDDGQRGPAVPLERGPGERRVLLLGDAFIEGAGVPEPDTLRAQLQRLMPASAQVLNAGVAGFSTDQELLLYRARGRRLHPDVVVLGFVSDDVYGNTASRVGVDRKPRFEIVDDRLRLLAFPLDPEPVFPHREHPRPHGGQPWRGSLGLRLISNYTLERWPRLHARLAALGLVQPTGVPAELTVYGRREELDEPWTLTRTLLRRLKQEIEADGGALVVLYVPTAFEIDDRAWSDVRARYGMAERQWTRTEVADRLRVVCDKVGLSLVDPTSALRRVQAREPAYGENGLWTAAGHEAAARALLETVGGHPPVAVAAK